MRPSTSAFVSGAGAQPHSSEKPLKPATMNRVFMAPPPCIKHHRQHSYFRSRPRVESVALAQIARIESHLEPAHPLLGGAMREGLRHGVPLRTLLNLVVADGSGGTQPFLEIACFEQVSLLCEKSPYAGVTVGLELEAHRHVVAASRVHPLRLRVELLHRAEQVLHVMADLVRDHIPLGEITGRTKAIVKLLKKRRIEIKRSIARTIERSDGRARRAASGPCAA